MRRWLRAKLRWLQRHVDDIDEVVATDAANLMREARMRAMQAGLPAIADMLRCPVELLGPDSARRYLSAALASLPDTRLMSVPQVARRYGVSPAKVRTWITSGQLVATNTGKRRARYRVTPEALAEFDARGVAKVEPRRQKVVCRVNRY